MALNFFERVQFTSNNYSQIIKGIGSLDSGTYLIKLDMKGNALISTLYVTAKDPGATIDVEYFDFTTGGDLGEETLVARHKDIGPGETDRRILARLHNKPVARIIITGGQVEFSLYGTVVSSFPSDTDAALIEEGQSVDLEIDRALPQGLYDPLTGTWHFARGEQGVQIVTLEETNVGRYHLSYIGDTNPGIEQTLINVTVPVGTVREIQKLVVACRSHASYQIEVDGTIIGTGRTGPSNPKDVFEWRPSYAANAGEDITLKLLASSGPIIALEAFLMGVDK